MNITYRTSSLRFVVGCLTLMASTSMGLSVAVAQPAEGCPPAHEGAATRRLGNRVFGAGDTGWVLRDAASGSLIASGDVLSPSARSRTGRRAHAQWVGMGGTTLALITSKRAEMRDLRDGHFVQDLSSAQGVDGVAVATDGSYVWTGYYENKIWSPDGRLLYTFPYRDEPLVSAVPGTLRLVSGDHDATTLDRYSVADGTRQTLGPQSYTSGVSWFDDGSHLMNSADGQTRFFDPSDYAQIEALKFPADRWQELALHGGFAQYYWGSWRKERRVDIFRLGSVDGLPVPTASIPVSDWGLPPRDDMRAHRTLTSSGGSLAVFGLDKHYFWLADLRGDVPKLTKVDVPEPLIGSSFSSDLEGHWSAVAKSGRIYASDAASPLPFHTVGCSAP